MSDADEPSPQDRPLPPLDLPSADVQSGATLEPNILLQYFMARMRQAVGEHLAAGHFIGITDPGSTLQHVAERERFRQVFFGAPDIGGRYSVLSNFGLVPAAVMGVDVARLLDRTELSDEQVSREIGSEL